MSVLTGLPTCSKCRTEIPPADFNRGGFSDCPKCAAPIRVEAFPALFRPAAKANAGELVMVAGESACFYHENKKAATVCEACGRFLCGLCDCFVHGKHLCPACLETGKQKRTIEQLDNVRPLYGYQAMLCALLPLFITGLAAIFISLRHRKSPGSLVGGQHRWQMPLALVLGSLQTLGFLALFYAMYRS
jgi:hypothetical protein